MNEIIPLIAFSISMLCMCIVAFTLGFRIVKCRPVLISQNQLRGYIGLLVAPSIIIELFAIAVSLVAYKEQISLPIVIATIFLLTTLILPILLVSRGFWLHNVTNDIQLESLYQALDKQGIKYSVQKKPKHITTLILWAKTTVVLDEIGSEIKVTSMTQGQGWIRIKKKEFIPNYPALITDFKENLATHHCNSSLITGVGALFACLLIGAMVIYTLAQFLF